MRYAASFLLVAIFWVLLGGHGVIDPSLHLHLGFPTILFGFTMVICTIIGGPLLFPNGQVGQTLGVALRFLVYLPWLLWQIFKSNVDLMFRTTHPDMPIDPCVIRFKTDLTTDLGMTILANSITLTPGTVTIGIEDGEYVIHAIAKGPADGLLAGDMQRWVKWVEGGSPPASAVPSTTATDPAPSPAAPDPAPAPTPAPAQDPPASTPAPDGGTA